MRVCERESHKVLSCTLFSPRFGDTQPNQAYALTMPRGGRGGGGVDTPHISKDDCGKLSVPTITKSTVAISMQG